MTEYIIGKAKVRIHGDCDPDKLRKATTHFLKQVEKQRKKVQREARS